MKRFYKFLIAIALISALLCLNACLMFMPPDQKFDGGVLLDSEKLSEIKSSVFSSEIFESNKEEMTDNHTEKASKAETEISEVSSEIEAVTYEAESEDNTEFEKTESEQSSEALEVKTEITESNTNTEEKSGDTVFWIANGEVWHLSQNCRYIKNKDFMSGTVDDAISANKTRVCSACGK